MCHLFLLHEFNQICKKARVPFPQNPCSRLLPRSGLEQSRTLNLELSWCDLPSLPPILGQIWRHDFATMFFQRTNSRCTVLKCEFSGVIFPDCTFAARRLRQPPMLRKTPVHFTVGNRQSQNQIPELATPICCPESIVCAPRPWRGSIGPTREDRLNFCYFAFLLPNKFSNQRLPMPTVQFQNSMSPMNSVAVDVTLVMGL